MKNFLFLSPHYPPRLYPFANALVRNRYRLLGIGDALRDTLPLDLQSSLSEYHAMDLNCYAGKGVFDEERYERIYKTVAGVISRHGRLSHIESFNEFWLPLEARLREDFHVLGPKLDDLQRLIRKSVMKDVFRSCGVSVVRGEIIRDLDHLLQFQKEEEVIIVKPDIGVGASDTHKISNPDEAREMYAQRIESTTYFMERFIAGPDRELLSFDGLTDLEGNVVFSTVHPVNDGLLEIVQGGVLSYFNLRDQDISPEFTAMGKRLVQAFGLKGRFFHIEFFRVGTTYYGIEINARPPGVLTLDMDNFAHGIDLWEAYARMLSGNHGPIPCQRDEICLYIGRVNRNRYRLSHDEVLSRYWARIVFSCPMDSPVMGDHAYLLLAKDHDERRQLAEEISGVVTEG